MKVRNITRRLFTFLQQSVLSRHIFNSARRWAHLLRSFKTSPVSRKSIIFYVLRVLTFPLHTERQTRTQCERLEHSIMLDNTLECKCIHIEIKMAPDSSFTYNGDPWWSVITFDGSSVLYIKFSQKKYQVLARWFTSRE